MQNNKIDAEIYEYTKEIASKMKNNRASVMIGAGFSKNAEAVTPTNKKFMDWNALGDVFFEKVNGRKPDKEKYLNVSRLAEEVENVFGRSVLNQLIKDSLPDIEYAPSEVHEMLLKLNWRDIFTTNYDTLLERTQEKITDRHYNVVLNKEDLIYSSEPRIIKLHGSFPSTLPFVITEEDYRQYPQKSSVFVNTVQQTLIENVLCLIGFSSDDPNFLQWIGWIRDNLGKDIASKIYLIGVFNFKAAQLNILRRRNIIVLDMGKCGGISNHKAGIAKFLKLLTELTNETDANEWPNEKYQFPHKNGNNKNTLNKLLSEWQKTRESYPGWFIMPYDKRVYILRRTNRYKFAELYIQSKNANIKELLAFLFEYNWRINKCLLPIMKREIKIYREVIFSFNPLPDLLRLSDNEFEYVRENNDWEFYLYMWTELLLDLLRAYRETGAFDDFEQVAEKLNTIKKYLTKEQLAKYNCEIVKKYMFQMNIAQAKKALDNWSRNVSLPSWEIKRAGILMELGDVLQARELLSDELNYVRKGYSKEINYYQISIEEHLKLLLSFAEQALKNFTYEYKIKSNSIYNPHDEIRLFEATLDERPEKVYEKETFDLNIINKTIIATEDKGYIVAFQFLRFFEEIGMPFVCNHIVSSKDAAIEAVKRITPYSFLWSLVLQIKISDSKLVDKIWTREALADMEKKDVSDISEFCISAIKNNIKYIQENSRWKKSNFQLGIAAVVPDILSRLCTKMSDSTKLQALEVLNIIYSTNNVDNFVNIDKFAQRLINSMSEKLKIQNFNALMKIHLYIPKTEIEKRIFKDIFSGFKYQELDKEKYGEISIDKEITEILLQLMKDENGRAIALTRLAYLYRFNLLNKNDTVLFLKILWNKVDEYNLPIIPSAYSKSYLLDLPVPDKINLEKLIKEYIISLGVNEQGKNIEITNFGNNASMLSELQWCTYSFDNIKGVKWNTEEINVIINLIVKEWNNVKKFLENGDKYSHIINLGENVRRKYQLIDSVLSNVLLSNDLEFEGTELLHEFIIELKKYNIPNMLLRILLNNDIAVFDDINDVICDIDENNIASMCTIIKTLVELNKDDYRDAMLNLLEKISFLIRVRRKEGLISFIYLMQNLVYKDILPHSNVIIDNLIFGLNHLIYETAPQNNTLNCSINQCISLRAAGNSLANILFKKYHSNSEIYKHMIKWKELSDDLNEFSDVRNEWLD